MQCFETKFFFSFVILFILLRFFINISKIIEDMDENLKANFFDCITDMVSLATEPMIFVFINFGYLGEY